MLILFIILKNLHSFVTSFYIYFLIISVSKQDMQFNKLRDQLKKIIGGKLFLNQVHLLNFFFN